MLLDVSLPESTFYTWAFILIIAFIFLASYLDNRFKKQYQLKTAKDKEDLAKIISDYQLKEAELKEKATQWGLIELEKFKQTELEAQKKVITENSLAAARNVLAGWIAENEERIRKDVTSPREFGQF